MAYQAPLIKCRPRRVTCFTVTDPGRVKGALQEAFAKAPALLDVVVTQDALSSDAGKGLGWVPDYQALTAWDDAEKTRRQ